LAADLGNTQFLRPLPDILRDYSKDRTAYRLGDRGEDFAALINTIVRDDAAHANYTAWLKELTPSELDDVTVLQGAKDDLLFGVKKDGVEYPATVLSDGTLRFAAIVAAFFQPEPPQLLMLEEIEEDLHPTRLQLLMELLKSQAGRRVKQVIATTHSPYTVAWLNEEDYRHVFLFTRNEETGATSVKPFSEVPHLVELAREQPISDLFAEGWLETAV
jgi:predicted ATPase